MSRAAGLLIAAAIVGCGDRSPPALWPEPPPPTLAHPIGVEPEPAAPEPDLAEPAAPEPEPIAPEPVAAEPIEEPAPTDTKAAAKPKRKASD